MPQFLTAVHVCRTCMEEKHRARYQFAGDQERYGVGEGGVCFSLGCDGRLRNHVLAHEQSGGSSTWRPTRPQLEALFGNHHSHNYPKFRYLEQSGSRSSGYFVNTYIIGLDVAGALVTVAL